jgi:hypothetical protein
LFAMKDTSGRRYHEPLIKAKDKGQAKETSN